MKVTILTICLLAFLFIFSTQTFAVDFPVNLTTDQHDASLADNVCDIDLATVGEQCTLRAAVEQANNLTNSDSISFVLPANSTITLTTANGGQIPITRTLVINGTGTNNLTIDGGAGTNRIFFTDNTTVTISGLTLTGGNGTGSPINNFGGAIFALGGSLRLDRVYVTGNSTTNTAGGVYFSSGTNLRISNSTFFNNVAPGCGGFYNNGGALTVINSTVTGNRATSSGGGGFCTNGTTTLRSVTVAGNTGAGIRQLQTPGSTTILDFGNTIVAGNTATDPAPSEIQFDDGAITSAGGNLIGDSAGDSTNTELAINYQATDKQDLDPKLGTLTINNGGTTPTRALIAGSSAIDAGVSALAVDPSNGNAALAFDQRGTGFSRIRDGNGDGTAAVDIGAFEVQLVPTAASVTISGQVLTPNGRGVPRALVSITGIQGNSRTTVTNNFGYFRFEEVEVGGTYTFTIEHKRYEFSPQIITVLDEISELNFTAAQSIRISL